MLYPVQLVLTAIIFNHSTSCLPTKVPTLLFLTQYSINNCAQLVYSAHSVQCATIFIFLNSYNRQKWTGWPPVWSSSAAWRSRMTSPGTTATRSASRRTTGSAWTGSSYPTDRFRFEYHVWRAMISTDDTRVVSQKRTYTVVRAYIIQYEIRSQLHSQSRDSSELRLCT